MPPATPGSAPRRSTASSPTAPKPLTPTPSRRHLALPRHASWTATPAGASPWLGRFIMLPWPLRRASPKTVVAYRSLSGRLIRGSERSVRPDGDNGGFRRSFLAPFGALVPVHYYAMQARRHMIDYGTTSRQFGSYALCLNANAQRNPNAIHFGRPITMDDHQNSPMIASPYRLYDCTQEADGACAVVVTSAERARDCPQRPAYLLAAAEGSGPADQMFNQIRHQSRFNTAGCEEIARTLYERAGLTTAGHRRGADLRDL